MGKPRNKRSKRCLEQFREKGIDAGIARACKLLTVMDKGDAIEYMINDGWRRTDAFLVVSAAVIAERNHVLCRTTNASS
jgi:predicted nucleotidyltransferase